MSDECHGMSQIHVVKCQDIGITVEIMKPRNPEKLAKSWAGKKPYSEKTTYQAQSENMQVSSLEISISG
jgi:phosphopantetheinyl transferase